MTLHCDPHVGIGCEITLQCGNLPTHSADRLYRHSIHVSRGAAQKKRGSHEVTRDQFAKDKPVSRHPYFTADNERNRLGALATLYQSLTHRRSDPGSDAQNLQDFPRRDILEDEPANILLLRGQFNWTPLDQKTPGLENIDRRKEH